MKQSEYLDDDYYSSEPESQNIEEEKTHEVTEEPTQAEIEEIEHILPEKEKPKKLNLSEDRILNNALLESWFPT